MIVLTRKTGKERYDTVSGSHKLAQLSKHTPPFITAALSDNIVKYLGESGTGRILISKSIVINEQNKTRNFRVCFPFEAEVD